MTAFSVPTFTVKCILREDLVSGDKTVPKGTMVRLPYGVALQALAQGVVGAIENADEAHAQAITQIAQFGADAWFPMQLQTMAFLDEYIAQAEARGFEAAKCVAVVRPDPA